MSIPCAILYIKDNKVLTIFEGSYNRDNMNTLYVNNVYVQRYPISISDFVNKIKPNDVYTSYKEIPWKMIESDYTELYNPLNELKTRIQKANSIEQIEYEVRHFTTLSNERTDALHLKEVYITAKAWSAEKIIVLY